MTKVFQGFKVIKFQVGDVFGTPIFHEHRIALYKTQNDNELDTQIRRTYKGAPKRAKKHSYTKCFRKTHREFRQD